MPKRTAPAPCPIVFVRTGSCMLSQSGMNIPAPAKRGVLSSDTAIVPPTSTSNQASVKPSTHSLCPITKIRGYRAISGSTSEFRICRRVSLEHHQGDKGVGFRLDLQGTFGTFPTPTPAFWERTASARLRGVGLRLSHRESGGPGARYFRLPAAG